MCFRVARLRSMRRGSGKGQLYQTDIGGDAGDSLIGPVCMYIYAV